MLDPKRTLQSTKESINQQRRRFTGAAGSLLLAGCQTASGPGALQSSLHTPPPARVVRQSDTDYELWRTAMPWQTWVAARYPKQIIRVANRADVANAIQYARAAKLQVAIKSGGHHVAEAFLRDGGLLLDLGELQSIEIDPDTKTAWVEPSLWSFGMMNALQEQQLAFPVAHCATVPMGGYLLGGGVGWNSDEWGGMACHNILAVEVVTAKGERLICSPEQHSDLFWAARGGGMGFSAVITRYLLQLYDLPRAIHESVYVFPLRALDDAVNMFSAAADRHAPKTELMMLLAHNPMASPDAPLIDQKVVMARAIAFADDEREARDLLHYVHQHPARNKAVHKAEFQATGFRRFALASVDVKMGLGFGRYGVDTVWTDTPLKTLQAAVDSFVQAPSPTSHLVVSFKANRTLHADAAFSKVGDVFVGAYARWDHAEDDVANFDWLTQCGNVLREHSHGQYINEVDVFQDAAAAQRCFSPQAWQRLQAIRQQRDPDGLFYSFPGA